MGSGRDVDGELDRRGSEERHHGSRAGVHQPWQPDRQLPSGLGPAKTRALRVQQQVSKRLLCGGSVGTTSFFFFRGVVERVYALLWHIGHGVNLADNRLEQELLLRGDVFFFTYGTICRGVRVREPEIYIYIYFIVHTQTEKIGTPLANTA